MEDIVLKKRLIGKGTYGKVYMAKYRNGGRLLEVKSAVCSSSLLREEQIIRYLGPCPHLISASAIIIPPWNSTVVGFITYLILEYAPGGSLKNLMQRRGGKLPVQEVRYYARMILRGICYVHA